MLHNLFSLLSTWFFIFNYRYSWDWSFNISELIYIWMSPYRPCTTLSIESTVLCFRLQGEPHNQTIAGIAFALEEVYFLYFLKFLKKMWIFFSSASTLYGIVFFTMLNLLFQLISEVFFVTQTLTDMGYELVSGGTKNHLVMVNLKNKVKE